MASIYALKEGTRSSKGTKELTTNFYVKRAVENDMIFIFNIAAIPFFTTESAHAVKHIGTIQPMPIQRGASQPE